MATRTITITSNSSKGIELAGVTVSGTGASYNSSTKQLTMSSSDTTTNNVTFKVKPKNSSKVTSKSLNMKTVVKKAYKICRICGTYVLNTEYELEYHSCYPGERDTTQQCPYCYAKYTGAYADYKLFDHIAGALSTGSGCGTIYYR